MRHAIARTDMGYIDWTDKRARRSSFAAHEAMPIADWAVTTTHGGLRAITGGWTMTISVFLLKCLLSWPATSQALHVVPPLVVPSAALHGINRPVHRGLLGTSSHLGRRVSHGDGAV